MLRIVILIVISNYCFGISDLEYASMPELFHLDNYDQCMLLQEKAPYCVFTFELQPLFENNTSIVWNLIKNVNADPQNYKHDKLRHGLCIPNSCSNIYPVSNVSKKEIIEMCYNKKYEHLGLKGNITELRCQGNQAEYGIDFFDIVIGVIFISYILIIILSSTYEGFLRYQKGNVYDRIMNTNGGKTIAAFSIQKNWQRLTSVHTNLDAKKLRSIQGIRFYNLICVILSHTIMVTFAGPISNPQYTEKMTKNPLNMFLANGNYAVQTFFVISGWLLSSHFFDMMHNKKVFHLKYLLWAFVNRYIRLTPTLAAMIAFESTWLVHLGNGPNWENLVAKEYRNCRENWWTNLLYVNNYINKNNMCLHQTWYIASDTQLYVLSLILLTFMWKYEKKVKVILGITIIIGLIIPGCIAYLKNYDIIIRQYPEILYNLNGLKVDAWHDLYSSGYSNITGYAIGLSFGYLYYKTRNKVITIKNIHIILWWILTFGMCDFIILIAARMYDPNFTSSRIESALYWAFGKNLFGLGIAIGIYGFSNKIGWFARWICEWKAVNVIGRLTYSTYIVHTAIIRIRGGLIRSPIYVNDYSLLLATLGDIALSYIIGTLICLLFEMPVSALQKLMLPQNQERNSPETEKALNTVDVEEANKHKDLECAKM